MRRIRTAVMALLLVGSLAACGDNEEGADPQDPVTVTETVTDQPSPTETTATPSPTADPTETVEPTEPSDAATSAPAVDLTQPPTTYAEAEAHMTAALGNGAAQQLRRFESSDGAYYCAFADEFIPPSCEILEGVKDPATCADSPSQKVGRIELTSGRWQPFCNTDTIRMPGAPVLAVGRVASWPGRSVQCVLEAVGLTCLQTADGQGFFFGPGRYQAF